ncbi:hypothetical protein GGS20DRAFT_242409 [Poronia punctata]|nr:hypothetical protein GGS20DRAFT_242409 [Poronia punctata]
MSPLTEPDVEFLGCGVAPFEICLLFHPRRTASPLSGRMYSTTGRYINCYAPMTSAGAVHASFRRLPSPPSMKRQKGPARLTIPMRIATKDMTPSTNKHPYLAPHTGDIFQAQARSYLDVPLQKISNHRECRPTQVLLHRGWDVLTPSHNPFFSIFRSCNTTVTIFLFIDLVWLSIYSPGNAGNAAGSNATRLPRRAHILDRRSPSSYYNPHCAIMAPTEASA